MPLSLGLLELLAAEAFSSLWSAVMVDVEGDREKAIGPREASLNSKPSDVSESHRKGRHNGAAQVCDQHGNSGITAQGGSGYCDTEKAHASGNVDRTYF